MAHILAIPRRGSDQDIFGFALNRTGRQVLCIGYRLRWRSDIWRTDRGVAEVRSPCIRPATDDDIRHDAPGLFETVDQLLRTKVRRKLLLSFEFFFFLRSSFTPLVTE